MQPNSSFDLATARSASSTIEGEPCDKPYSRNGHCQGHYRRMELGINMDKPWVVRDSSRTCSVDGCDLQYEANDLCHNHYMYDRRDRKRAAQVDPNGFEVDRLNMRLRMFSDTCWICGERIEDGQFNLDHVKPLTKGGAHTPANLRPSCASCNISKGNRWPIDTSTAHLRLDPARLP